MIGTEVMKDHSEVVVYDRPGIPLYIQRDRLSDYPDMRAICHWHDDIEFIYVWEGELNYHINGKTVLVKEHDSIMVNSRQMHYGYAFQGQDCRFSCMLFHPSLFTGGRLLVQQNVTPVLENTNLEYLYFDSGEDFGREVSDVLKRITVLKDRAEPSYELEVIGMVHILWSRILRHTDVFSADGGEGPHTDLKAQKDMVSYIYQNYGEKITLEDIAMAGHVCRSKCCMIFRHYLRQSPIEFLNTYRLKTGCSLLLYTDKSITEIAFSCGFNHLSYFSKLFQETYGCTPGEYRKRKAHPVPPHPPVSR